VAQVTSVRNPRSQWGHLSQGQSLVEFALVLPILVILLFGTIQLGITFGAYNGLINSVREAARYGSVCTTGPTTCGPATAIYLTDTKIPSSVFGYKGPPTGPTAKIEYQSYQVGDATTGLWSVRIRVSACVNSIIFVPLVGSALGLADPTTLPLKSVETFRVEGQPTAGTSPPSTWPPTTWTTYSAGSC
jgi:Flp pilus assembly protein TadG